MDAIEHRLIREKLGISQMELAGILGISQAAVGNRELPPEQPQARSVPHRDALLMRYMARFGKPEEALAAPPPAWFNLDVMTDEELHARGFRRIPGNVEFVPDDQQRRPPVPQIDVGEDAE